MWKRIILLFIMEYKMKLKLIGKQFVNFTGQLGSINWVNGVSETDVDPIEANRIASIVGAKFLDGSDASECDKIISIKNMESPYRQQSRPLTVEEIKELEKEKNKRPLDFIKPKEAKAEAPKVKIYTKEELEKIADEKGISGLRDIAVQFGVTSNSISSLIYKILDRQERTKQPTIPHYEDETDIED